MENIVQLLDGSLQSVGGEVCSQLYTRLRESRLSSSSSPLHPQKPLPQHPPTRHLTSALYQLPTSPPTSHHITPHLHKTTIWSPRAAFPTWKCRDQTNTLHHSELSWANEDMVLAESLFGKPEYAFAWSRGLGMDRLAPAFFAPAVLVEIERVGLDFGPCFKAQKIS